jgi:hypothetical protein
MERHLGIPGIGPGLPKGMFAENVFLDSKNSGEAVEVAVVLVWMEMPLPAV